MDHASPLEPLHELPADVVTQPADAGIDVPYALGTLPDGRETLIIGDVDTYADFTHRQGDNPYGFQGTCGLCSCEGVLRQFGVDVTEGDVVAHAVSHGLCETGGDDATARGGTTLPDQARILSDYGVPAHVESADSLEDLAANLEQGHGVIIAANAGVLWDDATYWDGGQANHAVVPIGVARDPATGEIEGFFVNDSGTGESARFVDAATMADSWLGAGGNCVVTDQVHAAAPGEGTPL
ncbi:MULTISPECIES: hypothetical protein [unclassified Streptomyces]|uniref:hypothetical protein n=1 Tax=unclassified Streptomyces TaxID=2593676 RepID=UPI00119D9848|nr:hypothetical protein [Streptomyces sp. BK340]TVZ94933.1 hypothetical protein FB157_10436 [Streptomyces sp. BK340]